MSHKQPAAKRIRALLAGARLLAPALLATSALASRVAAQSYARLDLGGFLEVGGEAERYTRLLQIAGITTLTPWSIQPFTPTQNRLLRRTTKPHPWEKRFAPDPRRIAILRPSARLIENSSFPYQIGNGPTWAGRGLTAEVQAGVSAYWGPFSAQLAPLAFVAQNAAFPLAPNGLSDSGRFRDARFPLLIDAPQRFGDNAYKRASAGTSWLAVDGAGLFAALTSAPQRWGPDREYPLTLAPAAGGFPALLLGSSAPWNLWIARVHARLVYGQLTESSFAPHNTVGTRLGEGIIGVIEPRGVPGLEIGASRFLHRTWEDRSWAALSRPFSQIVGANGAGNNDATENGIGEIFARFAVPAARAEFYGEFYKEDYPGTFHNGPGSIVENPDDASAFAFGFQQVLRAAPTRLLSVFGELTNALSAHSERLERGFVFPLPPYIHLAELQGHTLNGLILGSAEAYGGAAWRLGVQEYTPAGRRSVSLERALRLDWLPGLPNSLGVQPDVLYAMRLEWIRFAGGNDLGLTVIPAIDLNRNLVQGHNAFNLTVALSGRGWP